ncbi:metalloregulator ArsR/SmtB family transcription factor [Bryobacter aggregatus]|uniref:metalloregulator ArsR/SmtB family transcription factor n=1 Tax=Bryobacter aggregatus TaxID=360054 RepID=UPI0004E18CAC|nr:metalloregulator ArsR/SmtB family transcription factor [Bryobacter aggregatus]
MADLLKSLKLLGDESRLRLLRLLAQEELSVAELQEVLGMGQSRISMSLSQLKQAELVDLRKSGQKHLYRFTGDRTITNLVEQAGAQVPEASSDDIGLKLVLKKRKDRMRAYFDGLAGRFGRDYVPGRSWQALAEMTFKLLPPMRIVDVGAGEGTISLLLAQRAERVVAIDNSEQMIAYGQEAAAKAGVKNLEYRLGDLEEIPLEDGSMDLAVFSQSLHHAIHPHAALKEAYRVLRPGGKLMILDLNRHGYEEARELYADVWLGFSQVELAEMLKKARFKNLDLAVVHREAEAPFFETILVTADKPN